MVSRIYSSGMKTLPPLAVMALLLIAPGVTSAQVETEELVKLREGYEQARFRALDPIEKKYVAELEKLKARFTKESKLEEAMGVEAELKRLLNGATSAGFKGKLVPAILTKGEWKFHNKPGNYTTWLSFTATGDIFERGKKESVGKWMIKEKEGVLRLDFRETWDEWDVDYDSEPPVLKEKDSNTGKRRQVTLSQEP